MHHLIRDYLDHAEFATSIDLLSDATSNIAGVLGAEAFAYLALTEVAAGEKPLLISTYDIAWTTPYIDHRRDNFDPVVLRAGVDPDPFDWSARTIGANTSRATRDFFNEAAAFGIRCGRTIPIPFWRGAAAALTFVSDTPCRMRGRGLQQRNDLYFLIAYAFHASVRNLMLPGCNIGNVHLSRREIECLDWAMKGKSAGDTAQLLGISRSTVVTHLERAKAKLGVRTICQAVALYAAYRANQEKSKN